MIQSLPLLIPRINLLLNQKLQQLRNRNKKKLLKKLQLKKPLLLLKKLRRNRRKSKQKLKRLKRKLRKTPCLKRFTKDRRRNPKPMRKSQKRKRKSSDHLLSVFLVTSIPVRLPCSISSEEPTSKLVKQVVSHSKLVPHISLVRTLSLRH